MFGFSTAKLIGMAIGLAAILGYIALSIHWKNTMTARGEKLATICTTTRTASNIKDLPCRDVPRQIEFMGQAIQSLSTSLATQNAAIKAQGEQAKTEETQKEQGSKIAAPRANRSEATASRLEASSRSSERSTKPCEPSKALQDAWK